MELGNVLEFLSSLNLEDSGIGAKVCVSVFLLCFCRFFGMMFFVLLCYVFCRTYKLVKLTVNRFCIFFAGKIQCVFDVLHVKLKRGDWAVIWCRKIGKWIGL